MVSGLLVCDFRFWASQLGSYYWWIYVWTLYFESYIFGTHGLRIAVLGLTVCDVIFRPNDLRLMFLSLMACRFGPFGSWFAVLRLKVWNLLLVILCLDLIFWVWYFWDLWLENCCFGPYSLELSVVTLFLGLMTWRSYFLSFMPCGFGPYGLEISICDVIWRVAVQN